VSPDYRWSVARPSVQTLAAQEEATGYFQESSSVERAVYQVDPLCDPRWARFVDNHPRSSVFHTLGWLKALKVSYGYKPVVLTSSPPGTALSDGVVFCGVRSWITGRRLVSLPFTDHCDPLVKGSENFDKLLIHAKSQMNDGKLNYVEIRPGSIEPGSTTEFSKCITYFLHVVDLRQSLSQLFSSFHKECVQRKIRRAERERLQYDEGRSEEHLQKFYRLLLKTRHRHQLPPQPLSWFRDVLRLLGERAKIRVASHNGVPIASMFTLSYKKTVIYKYGCSDAQFHPLGGMSFLFWKTIQEAHDLGFWELDLGRSDTDNAGLVTFKDRWGAARKELNYWIFPQKKSAMGSSHPTPWQRRILQKIISVSPEAATKVAGRLLYRHIG
jgi:hypothetical protein